MTPINGYKEAQAIMGGGESLPPGGYKCVIVKATEALSKSGRPMLLICLDITDGQYKGYFSRLFRSRQERDKADGKETKWPCIMYQLADEEAVGRFKGTIKAIEDSNPGYSWEGSKWDEKTLKGKAIGVVFREEEYEKSNGEIGTSIRAAWLRNVDKVEDVEAPAKKTLKRIHRPVVGGVSADFEDDIPF